MIKSPWLPQPTLAALWCVWIALAIAIVWLANATTVDLTLADQQFDFTQHSFTQKHAFFYETVMHVYAKQLFTVIWLALLLLAWLPKRLLGNRISAATRYKLRWIVLLALLNAIVVSSLKHQMPHACPWDIVRYGGSASWVPTFTSHPALEAGHCFPAGHTTSGVWLSALGLLWLPQAPRKALLVTIAGLMVGFALGWAQQIRGAHFLSHTLTSLWLMCGWLLMVFTFSKSRIE
jgi:membrane-associated PAP2 superfamily phosphatase